MRIALVVPDMSPIWENIQTNSLKKPEYRPPMGLLYIAACLASNGYTVSLWDNYSAEMPHEDLTSQIALWQPDVVGISSMTTNYQYAKKLVGDLRALLTNVFLVMGGVHPTLMPAKCLIECQGLDAIVLGEGEQTMSKLVLAIEAGANWRHLQGIAYKGACGPVIGDFSSPVNLVELPRPDWSLLDSSLYDWRGSTLNMEPVYTVMSSRGCPYRCSFCGKPPWQRVYRKRPVLDVIDEIEGLVKHQGAAAIYFREDNFTADRRFLGDFCLELLRRSSSVTWECETRVDTLDRRMVKLMFKAGCRGLWCGVESGSQKVLDGIGKGTTVEQSVHLYDVCHEIGIATGALFMIGLPGETEKDVWKSYELALRLSPQWCGFQAYVGIPGCTLYDRVLVDGLWVSNFDGILEIETKELSRNRIRELEEELNRRFSVDCRRC